MSCWSCQGPTSPGAPFCDGCRRLQPVARTEDYYAIFDLPREFAVDPAELERRFRARSRQLHPDRFARAEPRERRIALERATRLNDAHRALRDWRRRAAYLLKLAGQDVFGEARTFRDPEFLEEQLEWREGLALARAAADGPALAGIAARARARLAALEAEVGACFEDPEWFSENVWEIARRLSRARYYDNIVAEAERAGPPGQEP